LGVSNSPAIPARDIAQYSTEIARSFYAPTARRGSVRVMISLMPV
jgi:hypothetical protein